MRYGTAGEVHKAVEDYMLLRYPGVLDPMAN
jgi:hypothetical protein